jgi:plastocyanin
MIPGVEMSPVKTRSPFFLIATLVAVTIAFVAFGQHASAATQNVTVGPQGTLRFSPNIVTIHVGDTATFNWASGTHIVDLQDVSPDLPIDSSHVTGVTTAFMTAGTYYYYCSIHADASDATEAHVQANDAMVGKIVVTAATAATPTTPVPTTTTPVPTATTNPNGLCNLTVADQVLPSGSKELVVAKAQQGRAGYVAIHESSAAGGPGAVIGFTSYLAGGSVNNNLRLSLDRPLKDGETVWAMLHTENNGNTTYDGAAVDLPTVDTTCGNPKTANIVTFPLKITLTAPGAPATGSGVAGSSSDFSWLWLAVGGSLCLGVTAAAFVVRERTLRAGARS